MTAVPPTGDLNARVSVYRDGALVGTRRQINFISDGDSGDDADSASPDRVNIGVGAGGTSTFGHPDATLSAGTTVGATTFYVNGTPNAKFSQSVIVGIGWGAEFEAHFAHWDGVKWNVSASNPLILAHSSGDPVWWIPDQVLHPSWLDDPVYAGVSNWAIMQRLFYMMNKESIGVNGTAFTCRPNQQVLVPSNNFYGWQDCYFINSTYAWVGAQESVAKPHSAAVMTSKYCGRFTATASDDTFSFPYGETCAGFQMLVNDEIIFNDPWGKGLPGGLATGKIYYLKTVGATTFTVSATVGGATLNLTTDGEGVAYPCIGNQDGKQQFNYIRIDNGQAGVNGFHCATQQQSSGSHLYVYHNGGTGTYAFFPQGQGMVWHDLTIIPDDNAAMGVRLDGTSLHTFTGYVNIISGFDPIMVVQGSEGLVLSCDFNKIWAESVGRIDVYGCRDVNFGKMYTAYVNDLSGGTGASWETEMWQGGSADVPIAHDSGGAWAFKSYDGDGADWQGSTDSGFRGPGIVRLSGRAPHLKERFVTGYASTGARVRQLDELALCNTGGANPWPLTIPAALCFDGNEWRFRRTAGANAIRVTPESPHTIDGGATKDFNDDLEHRIYVNGTNLITMY